MVPVKYMLLIYGNEESWAGLSAEQRERSCRAHDALNRELFEPGVLVGAYGVADPVTAGRCGSATAPRPSPTARTPRPRSTSPASPGRLRRASSGPSRSPPECPTASYVGVEVRPLMDEAELEM